MLVACMVVVVAVTMLARKIRLSAPLLLVVVGAAVSYVPNIEIPTLEPEVILLGVLPPLLYSASVRTSLVDFRANLTAIGWLSVGLVLFTALGVGLVAFWMLPIPFAAAFALGAIVAPPDAVAATAVARQIGLPRRVVTILEGESLVNDATALVALRTAQGALLATVSVGGVLLDFGEAVIIAVLVGVATAVVMGWLFRLTNDPVLSTTMTFGVPFIAFAGAEVFHASGVLAVVIAGLLIGHMTPRLRSAPARVATWLNWSTIQYALEHVVFLLIGLQTKTILADAHSFPLDDGQIALTGAAVLVAVIFLRIVWVMLTRLALRTRDNNPAKLKESVVISWAGMRGVVTLAAAMSLPNYTPLRPVLVLIALAVTVGTLLLQGLTLPWLVRRLRVSGPDPREDALQETLITQRAIEAGLAAAEAAAGPDDQGIIDRIKESSQRRLEGHWEHLDAKLLAGDVDPPSDRYRRLRLAALQGERDEVLHLRDNGLAEHDVAGEILDSLDAEESMLLERQARVEPLRSNRPTLDRSGDCVHLAAPAKEVVPDSHGTCPECVALGMTPQELRMCLECGHVGCHDGSPGQHATKHFRRTGHPVIRTLEPGQHWRYCYLDGIYADD